MYISSARGSTVVWSSKNMKLHLTFRQTDVAATNCSISSVRPTFIFQKELHHIQYQSASETSEPTLNYQRAAQIMFSADGNYDGGHLRSLSIFYWSRLISNEHIPEHIPRHAWTCQWSTRSLMGESWRSNVLFVIPRLLSAYSSLSGAMYVCLCKLVWI